MNVKELFSLKDKVCIVTGGRGLYGSAITEGMCEADAKVIIASRNGAKCDEYAQTLRDKGYDCVGMSLDLSNDESIKKLVSDVVARYGKLDVLVNNAVDRSNMVSFAEADRQKLQDSAQTNLNGQILLAQAAVEQMLRQENGGNIINISSMRGLDCPHFPLYPDTWGDQPVNYTTEKWALIGFTKYLAGRYGKNHIRVNAIAPGGFDPGLNDNPDKAAFVENYINNCPLGCWAKFDDIKGPVVFLASEASAYVTGATVVMDGGWTIW